MSNQWVVITQSVNVESIQATQRLLNTLKEHVIHRDERVVFVCNDDSLFQSLVDLIDETITTQQQQTTTLTTNVNVTNRENIVLSWNEQEEDNEHFIDGYNVWKEKLNMFCSQLINVDFDSLILENAELLELTQRLIRLLLGISLVGSISPKTRAQILSVSSEIVAHILSQYVSKALNVKTLFMNKLLCTKQDVSSNYLNTMPSDIDYAEKQPVDTQIIFVPGNIAVDSNGDARLFSTDTKIGVEYTVAAIAKLMNCKHAEFYDSGYGILTCHLPASSQPIDGARVINSLNFVEALEIAASTTSEPKVISPATLKIFQDFDLPLYIKSVHFNQSQSGTFISSKVADIEVDIPQIKSICLRFGIILISIDTFAMWHQVGFLSEIFALFKRYNLSVDYISTSEANVTCSLDTVGNEDSASSVDRMDRIELLVRDLENMNCRASILGPCAAISLVGSNIRGALHTLSPIYKIFNSTSAGTSHPIHLISQAHSNVNLSFIIPQIEHVNVLVTDIHNWLFNKETKLQSSIGKQWTSLLPEQETTAYRPTAVITNAVSGKAVWWRRKAGELLKLMEQEQQALYVYSADSVKQHATDLVETFMKDSKSGVINYIFYALKANPHPEMLKIIESMNFGFECVSMSEVNLVLSLFSNIDRHRILFTPNFAPREEYEQGLKLGIYLTLDNIFPLENWPELFEDKEIFLRIDPGIGKGHHKKVKTAGVNSKFGIPIADFPRIALLAESAKAKIVGMHAHLGSGILKEVKSWKETAQAFLDICMNPDTQSLFKNVRIIDLGGGLGVPYRPEDQPLDLSQVYFHLHSLLHGNNKYADFIKQRDIKFWIEPGRYLSAETGVIIARVTQTKKKDENNRYVGIETGMNSLIRPTLYNAYHEIVNLSGILAQNDQDTEFPSSNDNNSNLIKEKYTVVGPICETGDVLGEERWLHKCETGHVLVIACAGAYGHSMSSYYNNRTPAKEVFIN
jgi:diaminopimelate decarboxylase/aspartate kinase